MCIPHNREVMKRQNANLEILRMIEKEIVKHPYLRFHQILFILGINEFPEGKEGEDVYVDKYNEEPFITLTRMKQNEENRSDRGEIPSS